MKLLLSLAVCLVSGFAFASDKGNGGDSNEMTFKSIASNIEAWIKIGNADSLKFPNGITAHSYKVAMIDVLQSYHVSFTSKPVLVDKTEKTCKNWISANSFKHILCQSARFTAASTEQQYRLVHHELAGLAQLEAGTGVNSDYRLSEQIGGFLRTETVLRLPVKFVSSRERPAYAELQPYFVNPYGAPQRTTFESTCDHVDKRSVISILMGKMIGAVAKDLASTGRQVSGSSAVIAKLKETKVIAFDTVKTDVIAKFKGQIQLKNGVMLDVGFLNGVGSTAGGKDSAVAFTFSDTQENKCEFENATSDVDITSPAGTGSIRIGWTDVWPDPEAGEPCAGVLCR